MQNNIINLSKKKREKKLKEIYSSGYWYENTYNALGSTWLIKALKQLDLPMNYRLGNFSANAGWYEEEAFKISTCNPTYYISDIDIENIKKKIRPHSKNFKVISKNKDAKDITLAMIDNKPLDVILDCKGAVWHALNLKVGSYDQLLMLLNTYYKLLNKDGVLLIDWYDDKYWGWKNIGYHCIKQGNNKRVNLKYFGEASTKYNFEKLIKEDSKIDIWPMNLEKIDHPVWPLLKYMDVAVISKKEILKLINYLKANKKFIKKEYEKAAYKQLVERIMKIIVSIACVVALCILFYIMAIS